MGRHIVVMKFICSLGHCECDSHVVYELSQRRLTADWLAPRENDCSPMCSKVSSDWLPSYIKATRPVLEIFKMAGYFPDTPHIIERENNFHLYRETLYSVIFIKIPAVMGMSSYRFVDKVEYFGAIRIPWRWRQQASPKCLSTELHDAICLKTGTSAQSSYRIWRLLFAVSWPYSTPRVGGRAADY